MDISQLKTIIHVAELGSLSKASDRLGTVQPALSRQVRLLEAEFGTALFERHGRGMVLTPAGREVLESAVRIMGEIDDMRRRVAGGRTSLRGVVTVGTTPTVASIMTVPLASAIRREHPDLIIRFTAAFSGHLLDWVHRGELEIAVSYDPQPIRSLRINPIMMEDLLLVSSGNHLALDKAVTFADMAKLPLVLPSSHHGLRSILDDCAKRAEVTFDVKIEADSLQTMIDLVSAGFGSTILPLAPIYDLIKAGKLSAAPIIDPAPTRKVVLAYAMDRPITPAVRFVAEAFRDIARDLVARGIWAGRMLDR